MSRPVKKLLLASILLIATAFLPRSTQATTCCTNCLNTLDTCEANCHNNVTCEQGCVNRFNSCGKGCGPGGCGV